MRRNCDMYDKVCKKCGRRLSEYLGTGYLGCPDCYFYFADEIEASLKSIPGGTRNKGKRPFSDPVDKELLAEYSRLLDERERAGIEGRFGDMARLSGEINELFRELKKRGLI